MRWRRRGEADAPYLKHAWTVAEDRALIELATHRSGRVVRGGLEGLARKFGVTQAACKKRRLTLKRSGWKPPKIIAVPDPGKRVRAWGRIPAGAAPGWNTRTPRAADSGFKAKERPCSRCGKTFETTPDRRMLCATCFRRANEGLDD